MPQIIASNTQSPISVYTQTEKNNNELHSAFKSAQATYFVEYIYTDGSLTTINIWTDETKTSKMFMKTLSYVDGNLVEVVVDGYNPIRQSTKTLSYESGDLKSMVII